MIPIFEFLEVSNAVVALVSGLLGLLGTGVGVFFAIKNWLKLTKEKSNNELWQMIMDVADEAMKEAEAQKLSGAEKKEIVIETVKATLLEAGLDISDFIDQLSDYIDQTIKFVKDMKK